MEIKEIQNLIKFVAKSGAHEVKLETDDFKITIKANSEGHFSDSISLNSFIASITQSTSPSLMVSPTSTKRGLSGEDFL